MVTWGCFWFAAEAQIGLLAACLPTFGVFFKDIKLSSSVRSLLGSFSIRTSSKITESSEKLPIDQSLVYRTESGSNKMMRLNSYE